MTDSTYSISNLENQLAAYLANPDLHNKPFNFDTVPVMTKSQEAAQRKSKF
jgi:hypothetical protein